MADDYPKDAPPPPRRGCLIRLAAMVPMLGVAGLGVAMVFSALPQDLSDLGGAEPGLAAPQGRDLAAVLRNAIDRGFSVTLSEEEINGWLARTLKTNQGGLLEEFTSLDSVRVRLEEGHAEVIMERTIFGYPHTVSMFLRLEQLEGQLGPSLYFDGGQFHEMVPFPPRGGRFGQLTVPQGFLILVRSSFAKLAEAYAEELELGFEGMSRVRISEDGIIMSPPTIGGGSQILPDSF